MYQINSKKILLPFLLRITPPLSTVTHNSHVVPAAHVGGAVRVPDALRLAARERVADVVLDAGAHGAVVAHGALGVAAAGRGLAQLLWGVPKG